MVEQIHAIVSNPSPEAASSQGDICRHHWMIVTPNGSTSNGICKNCGEERTFRNSNHDLDWRGYRTLRPEVAPDDTNQGTPVALTIPVFRTTAQLGGKRIA